MRPPDLLKSGAKASDDSMKSPCTYVFQTQNATDSEEAVALTYACINEAVAIVEYLGQLFKVVRHKAEP